MTEYYMLQNAIKNGVKTSRC